ncbi:UDP-N-acetylmuramoyl-L-alanyl-D-glutamate--2,6-diaminopimelate ligase [Azospira sp. I13]|uniref:UDP-N-acetylmuramoyl-L-alanyl-D-glutamate--2, 6-diaminopimelate ligase n=1 Tax=Azospira sp. I13 TaxID=1765050 RepID=UPI000D435502|nr:UDP-N-acetylmuramoyl-L-alanyl-D-glutamate--2,6-diaminopimelate ligase [Azospira sp. I13]GBG02554.1 UDP-N-acetylmuramoyl-L-alanyl-D-glutamate--2,6-diaminopimelate ligase [Azospira sp. I13]
MSGARVAQELLDQLRAQGATVLRLENDSRRVQPGDVFVAYPGHAADGRSFIPAALARGAAGVFWEATDFTWDAAWGAVPNLAVTDLQAFAGHLAHLVYGRPSEQLALVGVTGTNGKTTCSQWIAQAMSGVGRSCAVIGTLGNGFPEALSESANTTPDALALHRLLGEYRVAGAGACAMEVSSIGLEQGRCHGARFSVAVFTNLTRDHLDYHGTMAAYGAAKERLFAWPELNEAVINLDDPFGRELLAQTTATLRIGYTLEGRRQPEADWVLSAADLRHGPAGLAFTLQAPQGEAAIATGLVGRYNVSNLLAVAGTLLALGLPLETVAARLAQLAPPAGRMQRFGGDGEPLVVVDYAHSPDALENALAALREVAEARGGRLVCVFGCGGDRDKGKRPLMGAVASRLADQVLLTSDNPRSEDPRAILADIAAGAPGAAVEVDRDLAVGRAVADAAVADVVLVAGKGHEPYQEVMGEAGLVRRPYSDIEAVARALQQRAGSKAA